MIKPINVEKDDSLINVEEKSTSVFEVFPKIDL